MNHRGIKNVNGIWLPDTEAHMDRFLVQDQGFGHGVYQYSKLKYATDLCHRRRRAIDVGAHVGTWSMHLGKIFGHVAAFEPHPLHRKCFQLNIDSVPTRDVQLYEYALGDVHAEEVLLSGGIDSTGDTWIAPQDEFDIVDGHPVGRIENRDYVTVDMRMLDEFEFMNVDFIKIDCEGFELPVLKGAKNTLHRSSPVICVEQKPGHGKRFGFGDTEACLYLESLGYTLQKEIVGDYIFTRR